MPTLVNRLTAARESSVSGLPLPGGGAVPTTGNTPEWLPPAFRSLAMHNSRRLCHIPLVPCLTLLFVLGVKAGPATAEGELPPQLQFQLGHSSHLTSLTFAANGARLASASDGGQVKLWHAGTGLLLRTLKGTNGDADLLAAGTIGEREVLLSGGRNGQLRVWDWATGKLLNENRSAHTSRICGLIFDPRHRWYVTASHDDRIKIWNPVNHECAQEIVVDDLRAVAVSDNWLASAAERGQIRIWDTSAEEFKELPPLTSAAGAINCLAFSADGMLLASGGDDTVIRIWDVPAGKEVQELAGHRYSVRVLAFHPQDGRLASAASASKATLASQPVPELTSEVMEWELLANKRTFKPTAKSPQQFIRHEVQTLAYGNNTLAIGCGDLKGGNDVLLYDTARAELAGRIEGHTNWLHSVVFSPSGRRLATGTIFNQSVDLWDLAEGGLQHQHRGNRVEANPVSKLAGGGNAGCLGYSPDEKRQDDHVIWVNSLAFRDDRVLAMATADRAIRLWDLDKPVQRNEEHIVDKVIGHAQCVTSLAFNFDGNLLASGSEDRTVKLWQVDTANPLALQEVATLAGHDGFVSSVAFHPRKNLLASGGHDGQILLWNANDPQSRPLRIEDAHQFGVRTVRFSHGGDYLASGGALGRVKLHRVVEDSIGAGRLMNTSVEPFAQLGPAHSSDAFAVAFSRDDRLFASGGRDRKIIVWDLGEPQVVPRFRATLDDGHEWEVTSLAFNDDGSRLISASFDGTLKIWNVPPRNGAPRRIGTMVSLSGIKETNPGHGDEADAKAELEWAVVDNEGRYDAAHGGRVTSLHWVLENEPLALEQLKEEYYEPKLLAKLLGFNPEPAADVEQLRNTRLFPDVSLFMPAAEPQKLEIKLHNRGGGIGRVVVKVNGREFLADARNDQLKRDPDVESATLVVDLSAVPRLKTGEENRIEVFAYNKMSSLRSRNATMTVDWPGKEDKEPPDVWILAAGVAEYRGEQLDLRYPARDAEKFAQAMEVVAQDLKGIGMVRRHVLTTDLPPNDWPTRPNLERAFQRLEKSKSQDIVIVYLSGHGASLVDQSGKSDYYYLTPEVGNQAELAKVTVRESRTLSGKMISDFFGRVPAEKAVLILDTCAAGQVISTLSGERQISSSSVRALERLKDRSGFHILAGSAADRVSYEATRYAQGLLTYSLLSGMRGAALQGGDDVIETGELFDFVVDEVPQLARNLGGIQRPVVASPFAGASFPIGRVTDAKKQPELTPGLALVLRVSFQDLDRYVDHLQISRLVNEELRLASTPIRQTPPKLLFVDTDYFDEGLRVAGRYRRGDAGFEGSMIIVPPDGQKSVSRSFDVNSSQPVDFARRVVQELVDVIEDFSGSEP